MPRRLHAVLIATLLLGVAASARAQPAADTLRIVWWDQIPNVDPYYNPLRTGLVVAHQAFDGLIYRDPETFQLRPLLATSWRYIDPLTLEFDLRRNVTFHNGDPFTADDVVYTVRTVLEDPTIAVPSNYAWLAGAEKVDDFKVRLKLRRVFPAALEYAAMTLPIYPAAYRQSVGPVGFARAPIGAGPYRITEVDGNTRIDMERFDGYYPDSPKGRPAIRRLTIHEVEDSATAVTELVEGAADWTWNFPYEQLDKLSSMPELVALRAETMRVNYLSLDAAGRTGAGNPLTNVKVRKAIFHAIDRQAIARQIVQGGSRVPDAPCFPTQFGCEASAAVRYEYDPDKARALLAEAGYPNGFSTELVSYLLPQYGAAVQNDLKAVGIEAKLTQLQVAAAVARSSEGRNPMDLGSYASYSINDVSAILPYFLTGGPQDYARDPEVQRLIEAGGASTSTDERRRYYSEAIRLITQRALWLPLTTAVQTYAFIRQLAFKPYFDELPRFFLSKWRP